MTKPNQFRLCPLDYLTVNPPNDEIIFRK